MKCLLCSNNIYSKVTWKRLFTSPKKLICDDCFFKYPIKVTYQEFPLDERMASWYSLFNRKYKFSQLPFAFELGKLFSFVLNREPGIILYFDEFEYESLDTFSMLEKFDERLIFITLFA